MELGRPRVQVRGPGRDGRRGPRAEARAAVMAEHIVAAEETQQGLDAGPTRRKKAAGRRDPDPT